jgi:hypothetical protein
MTEAEWLVCADSDAMIDILEGTATPRKLRLYAVACSRRLWHLLIDRSSRQAVEAAELYADDQVSEKKLKRAELAADRTTQAMHGKDPKVDAAATAVIAASYVRDEMSAAFFCSRAACDIAYYAGQEPTERAVQANLLRCIFNNPFRPVTLSPAWRTPTVLALAQATYENRSLPPGTLEPARLAVLADALEEVGCTEQGILGHLRGFGPHVRGCWPVDQLLKKE